MGGWGFYSASQAECGQTLIHPQSQLQYPLTPPSCQRNAAQSFMQGVRQGPTKGPLLFVVHGDHFCSHGVWIDTDPPPPP